MSTKCTIAHGPTFHLYHECMDDRNVYLEMRGTQFEADSNRVMVPIPVHVWEFIRKCSGVDLRYAEATDEALRQIVEQEVDERIKRYGGADEKNRGLFSLIGSLTYGEATEPREQQIATGLAGLSRLRAHQQQIQAAIQNLEQSSQPT